MHSGLSLRAFQIREQEHFALLKYLFVKTGLLLFSPRSFLCLATDLYGLEHSMVYIYFILQSPVLKI